MNDLVSDRCEVGCFCWIYGRISSFHATLFENLAGQVYLRLRERVIFGRVCRSLWTLGSWQCQNILREADEVVRNWQRYVKDIVQAAIEDRWAATSTLNHRIPIAVRDQRGGFGQQGREGTKDEITM